MSKDFKMLMKSKKSKMNCILQYMMIFSILRILVFELHVMLKVYSLNCFVVFSPFLIFKNSHEDYISIKLEGNSTLH